MIIMIIVEKKSENSKNQQFWQRVFFFFLSCKMNNENSFRQCESVLQRVLSSPITTTTSIIPSTTSTVSSFEALSSGQTKKIENLQRQLDEIQIINSKRNYQQHTSSTTTIQTKYNSFIIGK